MRLAKFFLAFLLSNSLLAGRVQVLDYDRPVAPKEEKKTESFSQYMKRSSLDMAKSYVLENMGPAEWEALLVKQTQGTALESFFANNPNVLRKTAHVLGTPRAFRGLLSLPMQKSAWFSFFIWMVGLFIAFFLAGIFFIKGTFVQKIFKRFGLMLGLLGSQVLCFYFHFKTQITPTLEILFL